MFQMLSKYYFFFFDFINFQILLRQIYVYLMVIYKARQEAQSFRLTCEDSPSVEYMARFIAKTQVIYLSISLFLHFIFF